MRMPLWLAFFALGSALEWRCNSGRRGAAGCGVGVKGTERAGAVVASKEAGRLQARLGPVEKVGKQEQEEEAGKAAGRRRVKECSYMSRRGQPGLWSVRCRRGTG